jgi:hypothetical protein
MVMSAALMALVVTVLPARARTARALSFLEYAILAAAIIGVGVFIATFFGNSIRGLQEEICNGEAGGQAGIDC